ncbi:MAG: leucine--tRNA ligase [Niveispirillum sp.]|nr:leucine--tRNA ligase [Niveispirillum sp.]
MSRYNVRETEAKWQSVWEERRSFAVTADPSKPKTYVLEMFPYPSGRIHMGHVRNYTIGDVIARYKRSKGFNVLHPMGWDAFGLPAENAALERNTHPGTWTYENIKAMRGQLKTMGLAIDWDREIATCRPEYYRFEQKMFLDFLKAGLAYRKESWVNWDPVDNTVLANEQVIDGRGWRTGALVEKRKLSQWFLKITHFADELLSAITTLDRWPEKVRIMQENWIGKSTGCRFFFQLSDGHADLEVFTTRPDTLFGASFVAISPNHPLASKLAESDAGLAEFIAECNRMGTSEATLEQAEKKGWRTPVTAEHPFVKGWNLPVYVANFVLMEYGTGAIFGCPAHDQRDLDFARKYDLPVKPVVVPDGEDPASFAVGNEAYTGPGSIRNSDFLDGLSVEEGKKAAVAKIEALSRGQGTTMFRLRDWGVSRQRYWGCPIPIIHCADCGVVPVPEDQLPVTLPADVTFDAAGNPLARHATWKHVKCPCCGKDAERETDTFDTFIESSWYFLRFADPRNEQVAFDKELVKYWLPVDNYIGGIEHAVLHLLYSRFWTRALSHCGYLDLPEPFGGLFTQGMVTHATFQDADGKWVFPVDVDIQGTKATKIADGSPVTVGPVIKMSKSKKNVVDPEGIIGSYGADAARLFMMSDSPPDRDLEWTEAGIDGAWRYINRLWRLVTEPGFALPAAGAAAPNSFGTDATALRRAAHKAAVAVGEDIEGYRFNSSVAKLRTFTNALGDALSKMAAKGEVPTDEAWAAREALEYMAQIVQPVMPHLAQQMWEELGHGDLLVDRTWPVSDAALLVDDSATVAVQVNGKLRATLTLARDCAEAVAREAALADVNVQRAMDGKEPRKIIVVPNRIVNIVV